MYLRTPYPLKIHICAVQWTQISCFYPRLFAGQGHRIKNTIEKNTDHKERAVHYK